MALDIQQAIEVATSLHDSQRARLQPNGSIGKVARYLAGDHDKPYMPANAKTEFQRLAERSITNWLPLVSDTFAKALFVDGYRPARAADNAAPWDYWQANGLDSRQSVIHRSALEYGESYALVLPGDTGPSIRPLTAKRAFASYADPDDEFPVYGLVLGSGDGETRRLRLIDDELVHSLLWADGRMTYAGAFEHGLGVAPMVRFRERLDGEQGGIIRPILVVQDRINESVFALMVALQYASFRQRWATGLAIPVDETETLPSGEANPNFGKPVEAFQAAVDRLWYTENPDASFGDFAQTQVDGHLRTYDSAVQTLSALAQTPPHVLMGDLVNLSADSLAAAESATQRKVGELETIFGESWEQTLRLAAAAGGDEANASDSSAQVRWRDTEARSLAATVDALGKVAQMLAVPPEALWERIPGVTDQDVERWRELAGQSDGLALLASALDRQATPVESATPEV